MRWTLVVVLALVPVSSAAAVRTGSTMEIEKEVLDGAGGEVTSTTYILTSAVAQPHAGYSQSASYITNTGFLASLFAPRIDLVSPGLGPWDVDTPVTITGLNFIDTPTVEFGGVSGDPVVRVSATEITAVAPAASGFGPVDVRVVNPDGGEDTLSNGFTYCGGPGDLNGDGWVDGDDLIILVDNFGLNESDAIWDPRADPDGNGRCNIFDVVVVEQNWGNDYPPP